jgi:DNA-binding NarL/FixJ family response regulator
MSGRLGLTVSGEIAGELCVKEVTVGMHAQNLYRKLGIASRTELFRKFGVAEEQELTD